ncbi:hypothetical protein N7470_009956 [Penicillium chermesinum]|nr:hypothetical protein N7470_009956 [Penicillium chermesinum]
MTRCQNRKEGYERPSRGPLMQQCQPSSSLPNPQHPKPEVLNLLAPERIHHPYTNRPETCTSVSPGSPFFNSSIETIFSPSWLISTNRLTAASVTNTLSRAAEYAAQQVAFWPGTLFFPFSVTTSFSASRSSTTAPKEASVTKSSVLCGIPTPPNSTAVPFGDDRISAPKEPSQETGITETKPVLLAVPSPLTFGPGRRCRLVQGKSGEGFEFGEAVGAVLGAGDARLGAGVSDAGEAEFLGCGDGYGEVAGDCRLAEAGEGSVCVGDLELGNGAGAGVDDEDVLRMGVRVNFHMEWKARMGVSTYIAGDVDGALGAQGVWCVAHACHGVEFIAPHASSRHGGAAVQGSVEGNWDANEVVGLVVGLEIQGFASGQCITGAAG